MDRETPLYAGLIMSLHKYSERLREDRNHKLNTNPREIDVRIIDKLSGKADRMDNAIAYFFERHNIIELKNPAEPLNIDVIWKGISYAAQYKSMGVDDTGTVGSHKVNAIPMSDITLTFLRLSKPHALFKELDRCGYQLVEKFPGVYYLFGMADIKTQIVVGNELRGDEFVPLRVQRKNLTEDDAEKFVKFVSKFKQMYDVNLLDSIFQLSIADNKSLYDRLRKEREDMCNALRELMKDELEAAEAHGRAAGLAAGETAGKIEGAKAFAEILMADGIVDRAVAESVFGKMGISMPT